MALAQARPAEPGPAERELLAALLDLYAAESRLYREVLALSRRQSEMIRAGRALPELRELLAAKRERLDAVASLEEERAGARALWEAGRERWSGAAAARLHAALREVGAVIEEILLLEETNDRLLMEAAEVSA
jgi:hypothetical protein